MATGQGRGAMFLVLSLVGGMLVTTYVYQLIRGFDTRLENAQRPKTTTEIVVDGWSRSRRDVIATLLGAQSLLDNNLERIVLRSDGAIQLRCGQLGEIDLGRNIALLNRQIDAIQQLSLNLPKAVISGEKALIDLSNPDRPEIQLPAKATS